VVVIFKQGDDMKNRKRPWTRIITLISIGIFVILVYLFQEYPASVDALKVLEATDVTIVENKQGYIIIPEKQDLALGWLIYPGGKVNPQAYLPLAYQISVKTQQAVVIVSFPFNLAVLNIQAGKKWMNDYQDIKQWVVVGHSLGGVMGAELAKNDERIGGVAFLAAYPNSDFSQSNLPMISIRGSQDNILNQKAFLDKRPFFSSDWESYTIEGANHSQFASYGFQRGDGIATISQSKQHELVVELLVGWSEQKILYLK